jgi:hypothetical protein
LRYYDYCNKHHTKNPANPIAINARNIKNPTIPPKNTTPLNVAAPSFSFFNIFLTPLFLKN